MVQAVRCNGSGLMNMEPEDWREVAFSYKQIEEFLQIAALPHSEATSLFRGQCLLLRCYGIGFYFFINSIKDELSLSLAEELHTLACRVEQTCLHYDQGNWEQNAAEAARLLATYFGEHAAQQVLPADGPASPSVG